MANNTKKAIFDKDNSLNRALYKIGSLVLANFLFLICSIPIITFGASLTALNKVCFDLKEERDKRLFRTFFGTFGKCFFDATLVWIICAGLFTMFLAGGYACLNMGGVPGVIGAALCLVGLLAIIMEFAFYFMLLSRYENTIMNHIKNAFLFGFSHLAHTILIVIIWVVYIGVFALFPRVMLLYFGWFLVMIGFAVMDYWVISIYRKIFRRFETMEED